MRLPENELITLDEEYRISGIRKSIGISTIFLSVAVFLVLCTLFTGVLGTAALVLLLFDILAIYVPFLSIIISQYLSSKRAWKKRLKLETEGAFIEGTISAVRHVCADESTESYDYLIVNYVDNKITHTWTSPSYSTRYDLRQLFHKGQKCTLIKGDQSVILHRLQDIDFLNNSNAPVVPGEPINPTKLPDIKESAPSPEEDTDEFFITSKETISLLPKDYAQNRQSEKTPDISQNTLPGKKSNDSKTRSKWWLIPTRFLIPVRLGGVLIESLIFIVGYKNTSFHHFDFGRSLLLTSCLLFIFATSWIVWCSRLDEETGLPVKKPVEKKLQKSENKLNKNELDIEFQSGQMTLKEFPKYNKLSQPNKNKKKKQTSKRKK